MSTALDHSTTDVYIEGDSRGRYSLAKIAGSTSRRYLAHSEPDGTIVLEPAVVLTETQARVNANPELLARITQGGRDGRAGTTPRSPRRDRTAVTS